MQVLNKIYNHCHCLPLVVKGRKGMTVFLSPIQLYISTTKQTLHFKSFKNIINHFQSIVAGPEEEYGKIRVCGIFVMTPRTPINPESLARSTQSISD